MNVYGLGENKALSNITVFTEKFSCIKKEFIDLRNIICMRKFESLTFQN